MMSGVVNSNLEPLLTIMVRAAGGDGYDVEALVDTGSNGFLTLGPDLIAALGLSWVGTEEAELADGSLQVLDVFVATIDWHGRPKQADVQAVVAQPLLGMSLMQDSELRIDVAAGGSMSIIERP
jgi:clan AA aspartic protease